MLSGSLFLTSLGDSLDCLFEKLMGTVCLPFLLISYKVSRPGLGDQGRGNVLHSDQGVRVPQIYNQKL